MPIDTDGTFDNDDNGVNAFLKLWDAEEPSEKEDKEGETETEAKAEVEDTEAETETDENDGETTDAEEPSEDTEETEGEAEKTKAEKKYADDEGTYVKVKVGEEEHEVAVKDLKRLFGQEASLTKKSQEVSERTKAAELAQAKSLAALDVMVKRAQETANPYRNVNWAALMKDPTVSAEDVGALQEAAKAAFENEVFLTSQLDGFVQEINAQQAAANQQAAQACIQALKDEKSPTYIKGWDQKLYNDMRSFAVSMGANQQMVDGLADPAAFKLIHMAMQFHKGTQKVVTQKVNKAPKKIVKASTTSSAPSQDTTRVVGRQKAVANLKKSGGTMDATQDAFMSLFGGDQ
jgi:hypothetical protein